MIERLLMLTIGILLGSVINFDYVRPPHCVTVHGGKGHGGGGDGGDALVCDGHLVVIAPGGGGGQP